VTGAQALNLKGAKMQKLNETISKIEKIDYSLAEETQKRLDNLTKPQGSLGTLEELAKQVVEITKEENPPVKNKVIFTLAADHGIVEEGVSAFPKEVTPQMVYNFLSGGAGVNVLARLVDARVVIVDIGVATKLQITNYKLQNFKDKKINYGTKNMLKGPAMTREEAIITAVEALKVVSTGGKFDIKNVNVAVVDESDRKFRMLSAEEIENIYKKKPEVRKPTKTKKK